jgi:glucosamine-6-phosphate deaminase
VELVLASDATAFARIGADYLAERAAARPSLALTLPTGSTPDGLYEVLAREHAAGRRLFTRANVFMLDEYLDLPAYPVASFYAHLRASLGPVVFNESTRFHRIEPSGTAAALSRYDAELDDAGGLDLAVLGVGRNGHVGFNEPGTPCGSRTHVARLAAQTLEANFAGQRAPARPRRAVTIGLRDLLGARAILMLVRGAGKEHVASLLATGRQDHSVPATLALAHDDLTIVMDETLLD